MNGGDTMLALHELQRQVVRKCNPTLVLLFGSQAKGTAKANSDIDLCIVAETRSKRKLLTELYCDIESEKPIDFILYTPDEWAECVSDHQSFAYKINREGVRLYGG